MDATRRVMRYLKSMQRAAIHRAELCIRPMRDVPATHLYNPHREITCQCIHPPADNDREAPLRDPSESAVARSVRERRCETRCAVPLRAQ